MYTPQGNIKEWRKVLKAEFRKLCTKDLPPYDVPLRVDLQFFIPRVATATPDLDNLCKPVLDVLNELKFWKDDSYVIDLRASKAKSPMNQGVYVSVSTI